MKFERVLQEKEWEDASGTTEDAPLQAAVAQGLVNFVHKCTVPSAAQADSTAGMRSISFITVVRLSNYGSCSPAFLNFYSRQHRGHSVSIVLVAQMDQL